MIFKAEAMILNYPLQFWFQFDNASEIKEINKFFSLSIGYQIEKKKKKLSKLMKFEMKT